jgi:tRNA wybutosine-synthesizing protein 3
MDKSKQGFVDEDIRRTLDLLKSKGYETTSSCSGRIVLLSVPEFGDKRHAEWLYKEHGQAYASDVLKILEREKQRLYFLQEPPIIHANCKDMASAGKLLNLAFRAGFKRSAMISIKNFTVEIKSGERLETPLNVEAITPDFLDMLVEEANQKLAKGKAKIKKLACLISSI